jgi:uncharacterized membrane protein
MKETKLEKTTDFFGRILNIMMVSIIHLVMFGLVFLIFYQGIIERNLFYLIFGVVVLVVSIYILLITIQYDFLNKEGYY